MPHTGAHSLGVIPHLQRKHAEKCRVAVGPRALAFPLEVATRPVCGQLMLLPDARREEKIHGLGTK